MRDSSTQPASSKIPTPSFVVNFVVIMTGRDGWRDLLPVVVEECPESSQLVIKYHELRPCIPQDLPIGSAVLSTAQT